MLPSDRISAINRRLCFSFEAFEVKSCPLYSFFLFLGLFVHVQQVNVHCYDALESEEYSNTVPVRMIGASSL